MLLYPVKQKIKSINKWNEVTAATCYKGKNWKVEQTFLPKSNYVNVLCDVRWAFVSFIRVRSVINPSCCGWRSPVVSEKIVPSHPIIPFTTSIPVFPKRYVRRSLQEFQDVAGGRRERCRFSSGAEQAAAVPGSGCCLISVVSLPRNGDRK